MGPTEYARHLNDRYGVRRSKQAISKDQRLPRGADGKILVDKADAFLVAAGVIPETQLTQGSVGNTALPPMKTDREKSLYEEKAATERVIRELKELDLAEKRGELLRVADVTEAMVTCGRRIGEALETLPALSDKIAALARDGGAKAVQAELKTFVRDLRETVAESMRFDGVDEDTGDEDGDA